MALVRQSLNILIIIKNAFYINVSILKYVNGHGLYFILKFLKNEITFF